MKKVLIILLIFVTFVVSGCSSSKDNNQDSGFVTNTINEKRLEAHDKYLIAKTKEMEIMVELYMMDNSEYPFIEDSEGNPVKINIYHGSEDLSKLENLILSTPSLRDIESIDISKTVGSDQPIEYFSDGKMFRFDTYLTYNKEDYEVSKQNIKCLSGEDDFCIFTISNGDNGDYEALNTN